MPGKHVFSIFIGLKISQFCFHSQVIVELYRVLGWQWFYIRTLKLLFRCFAALIAAAEKSVANLIIIRLEVSRLFSLINYVFLFLIFCNFAVVFLGVIYFSLSCWILVYFFNPRAVFNSRKFFWAIISFNTKLCPILSFFFPGILSAYVDGSFYFILLELTSLSDFLSLYLSMLNFSPFLSVFPLIFSIKWLHCSLN